MDRLENWQSRMHTFLLWAEEQPLEWGIFDCGLFAVLHADNICGTDIYQEHAGKYHDRESLVDHMKSIGVSSHEELAEKYLGERLPTIRKAQRGDIVIAQTASEGPAFAVVDMTGTHIVGLHPSGKGLIRSRLACASYAWRL